MITSLLVSDDDEVTEGMPIMVVETSKAAVEIEAAEGGPITFLVAPGDSVKLGRPIYRIGAEGPAAETAPTDEDTTGAAAPESTAPAAPVEGFVTSRPYKERRSRRSAPQRAASPVPEALQQSDPRKAAEIAALSVVNPSGLVSCLFAECGCETRTASVGPLFESNISDILIYETARLVSSSFPKLNARFDETQGGVPHDKLRIGYSIDTDDDLTVYNLGDCAQKTLTEVRHAIEDATEAHLTKKISAEQMKEATITLSDLSGSGVGYFLPLINGSQSCILGYASGEGRAYLSLAFDHRVLGGAYASKFLAELTARVEAHFAEKQAPEVACDVCGRGPQELKALQAKTLIRAVDLKGNDILCCRNCLEEM